MLEPTVAPSELARVASSFSPPREAGCYRRPTQSLSGLAKGSMKPRSAISATLLILLSACAPIGSMLPGTIYSRNGKVMPLQIAVSTGSGAITASDPTTGERFSGTYVGILERTTGAVNAFGPAGFGVATGSVGSNIASSTAYLSGDKGTMLTCQMQIAAGLSPHGIGGCEDNKGTNYGLQF